MTESLLNDARAAHHVSRSNSDARPRNVRSYPCPHCNAHLTVTQRRRREKMTFMSCLCVFVVRSVLAAGSSSSAFTIRQNNKVGWNPPTTARHFHLHSKRQAMAIEDISRSRGVRSMTAVPEQSQDPQSYRSSLHQRPPLVVHAESDMERSAELESSHEAESAPAQKHDSHQVVTTNLSPELIAQIKSEADILSVVESHNLPSFTRISATRATALCPFHDDSNPSLSIDKERGLYKCFACGAGGDVFNFVREYGLVRDGGTEKMSFRKAVSLVAKEFTGISLPFHNNNNNNNNREEKYKDEQIKQQKNRLLLANAAAADVYRKALMSLNSEAGIARAHLCARGITASTASTFALGYAPDAYFNTGRKEWGEGSLVNLLKELGFISQEILDAGLATRRKKRQFDGKNAWSEVIVDENKYNANGVVNTTTSSSIDNCDEGAESYSDLMDRFRGRLMVPIFDETGKHVVGFGGRHLDVPEGKEESSFKASKYLNSPESLLFSKKKLLFGLHTCKAAIDEIKTAFKTSESKISTGGGRRHGKTSHSVVIVEGYFDAVSLYQAGVREVVASMGTALSLEQLELAAHTAGTHGGRIILCLDGDEAGLSAIERLCSGNIFAKVADRLVVDILVASLPKGIKDPAEFIESRRGSPTGSAGDSFRTEVLNVARPWSRWYIDRLIFQYDAKAVSGTQGSFSNVCDNVSSFLSTFSNAADRTRRAYEAAGVLADIIAAESGQPSASSPLRTQLEFDLLDMASRRATVREAVSRRLEETDGVASSENSRKVARMSSGESVTGFPKRSDATNQQPRGEQINGLSIRDNQLTQRAKSQSIVRKIPPKIISRSLKAGGDNIRQKNMDNRRRKGSSQQLPFTPHFSGIDFLNPSDAAWLGIPTEEWRRRKTDSVVGDIVTKITKANQRDAARNGGESSGFKHKKDIVYFNSNEYHGKKFITQNALDAGYEGDAKQGKDSLVEFGIPALIDQDSNQVLLVTESRLLRVLVHYAPARVAMKAAMATSLGTGSFKIEWSTPERQWLFQCLIDGPGVEPLPSTLQDGGTIGQLRRHLSTRNDVPSGAFGQSPFLCNKQNDSFFSEEGNGRNVSPENKISLTKPADLIIADAHVLAGSFNNDHTDVRSFETKGCDPNILNRFDESALALDTNQVEDESKLSASEPAVSDSEITAASGTLKQTEPNVEESSLDKFFSPDEDFMLPASSDSVSLDIRAELIVQETLAMMLKATAIKRMYDTRARWEQASNELLKREDGIYRSAEKLGSSPNSTTSLESIGIDELKALRINLGNRLTDAMRTVNELSESAKRIGTRLLDYCSAEGVEGRLSVSQQEKLAKMVDSHLANLPEDTHRPSSAGFDEGYIFGMDDFDGKIDPRFGGSRPTENGCIKYPSDLEVDESSEILDQEFVNFVNSLPDKEGSEESGYEDDNNWANSLQKSDRNIVDGNTAASGKKTSRERRFDFQRSEEIDRQKIEFDISENSVIETGKDGEPLDFGSVFE